MAFLDWLFGSGSGDGTAIGSTPDSGIVWAPGMTAAGYTLAPGTTEAPSSTGLSWGGVAKGLDTLGKGLKDTQSGQSQGATTSPNVSGQATQAPLGTPTNRQSLDALVQMLNKRRDQYMQQAMSGRAQPIRQPTTQGLLGF